MPTCCNCQQYFPNRIQIEGKWKVLNSRKFCLDCSPYKLHNTSVTAPTNTQGIRRCSTCGLVKPLSNFYRRYSQLEDQSKTERRKHECKVCHNERSKLRLQTLKQRAVDLKGGKCCLCGYSKSITALDFHHL